MNDHADLANALSELFSEEISYTIVREQTLGDAGLLVIEMRYTQSGSSGHSQRIRQTAVVLEDAALDLPQFTIWPHFKGVAGMLVGRLIGMRDINFPDAPEFSKAYHLHAWNEPATRILFTGELRDSFVSQPGWSARGVRNRVVVFKQNEICPNEQLDDFLEHALEILGGFQRGEEALDDQPDVRREADLEDLVSAVEESGGLHAVMLKRMLKQDQITPSELESFLAQPVPRSKIPAGMKRQVIGDNLMLAVLGVIFFIAGIVVSLLIVMYASGSDRWIAIPFGILFPLIGGTLWLGTVKYRRQKRNLLCLGTIIEGRITDVERTAVKVNNAQRYHVHLDYQCEGQSRSAVINLYSNIEKARKLASTGEPVRLLVAPGDPSKVICMDTLLVFH